MPKNETSVHPSERPADELITFNDIIPHIPGFNRRLIERMVADNRFPPGARYSDRGGLWFRAGAVAAWIAERSAVLDAPQ